MNARWLLGLIALAGPWLANCSNPNDEEPAGANAHQPADQRNRPQLLTSPSSFEDVHDTIIDGVHFLATMETPPRYLSTDDTSFRSPEGARVGMHLIEAQGLTTDSVGYLHGWGYVLRFPSGWTAGFVSRNYDNPSMAADSSIGWLYRRGL